MKSCATCEHFAPNDPAAKNGNVNGACHAHPPLTVPINVPSLTGQPQLGFTSGWPPVQGGQWCGEHRPKLVT